MKNVSSGFTIIETMLFLGISSLLIVGVLATAGTSINVQRYRDSVVSLQAVFQQQYSDVANVFNDSAGNIECFGSSTTEPRGQSSCVILGRIITSSDGSNLNVRDVIGYEPLGSSSTLSDVDALKNYNIRPSSQAGTSYELEWGTRLDSDIPGNSPAFSLLILRSPTSGAIRTFIDPLKVVADNSMSSMVSQTYLSETLLRCVNSNGLFSGGKSAVVIRPNSSNGSGVETLGETMSGC